MATGNPANSASQSHTFQPGLGFALLLIIAVTLMAGVLTPLYSPAKDFTIVTTTLLGNLLGLAMTSKGDILTVNGFAMQIIGQCTALNYIVILTLAILFYTRHSVLYRIGGVAVATGIVLLANAIRLIVTGLAGTLSYTLFCVVHEYIFVAIFSLLVFAVWKVWADQKMTLSRETMRQAALIAVCCTATFLLLILLKDFHCRFLTILADPLFKLLLGDSQATLIWDGKLLFRQGEKTLSMGIYCEIANLAVYGGLMLPYMWRNRKAIPLALLGLVVLVLMYSEFIAIMGMNGINRGLEYALGFGMIGSGIFMVLPMALYWVVTGMANKERI